MHPNSIQGMRFNLLVTICGLAFLGWGIASAKTSKMDIKGATSEVYKKASGDDLWIYRFDPEGHDAEKDKRPAVVFFFGGGWNGGTPKQFIPHSQYLASRGIVAFVADYRVKSRQKTTPRECVADGKSAVRWIRKNAARLGIDPEKVLAGGGSAGGHVAAATGFCDGFDEADEDKSISSKPVATLLFNPVYDNGEKGYGHDRVKEWFPAISPAHSITKDDPPTIVFLGSKDKLIPVSTGENFRDKMTAAGIKNELHIYEGATHGFFNQGKKSGQFSDTVLKMDKFLVELGYLSGEPNKELLAKLVAKPKVW